MRRVGPVLVVLAAATHLPACAAGGSGRELRGQSGAVAWEIVDIRQELEPGGSRMRWDFSLVFWNTGAAGIAFERVDIASQAGGTVDSISGGMGTVKLAQRLEPGAEWRVRRSESWGCPQCAPAHLPRFFSDGIVMHYTLFGRDDAGLAVRVPVAIRLNSGVGQRP
jgi:hypothetical protein